MNFLDLAKSRFSARKFETKPVGKEKIDLILEAGKVAPTAVNYQPQKILVLTDKDKLLILKECTKYDFDAPLAFLVCYDKNICWKRGYDGKSSGETDAAIVATHMMLEAKDLGIGSTWVMSFDPEKMRKAFDVCNDYEIAALLPMGYTTEDVPISKLHSTFRDEKETVFYNSFED